MSIKTCEGRAVPRLSLAWWSGQLGLSRRKLLLEISSQKLRAIRVGSRTLVLERDMMAYLDRHATIAAATDDPNDESDTCVAFRGGGPSTCVQADSAGSV